MITIPHHPKYTENSERCKADEYPCIVCGKPCPNPKYMAHLWYGTTVVTEEEATKLLAEEGDDGDMGFYPVGSDCFKKHSELLPYAIKQEEQPHA